MSVSSRYNLTKYTLLIDSFRPGITSTIESKEKNELAIEFLNHTKVFRIVHVIYGCPKILEEHPVIGPKAPLVKCMNSQMVLAVNTYNMGQRKFRITFSAGPGRTGQWNSAQEQMKEFSTILATFIDINFCEPRAKKAPKENTKTDAANRSFSDFSMSQEYPESPFVDEPPLKKPKKSSGFRDPRKVHATATVSAMRTSMNSTPLKCSQLRPQESSVVTFPNLNQEVTDNTSQELGRPDGPQLKRTLSQDSPFMNMLFSDGTDPNNSSQPRTQEITKSNSQSEYMRSIFSPRPEDQDTFVDMNKTPDKSQEPFYPLSPKKQANTSINDSFSRDFSFTCENTSDSVFEASGKKVLVDKAVQTDKIGDVLKNPDVLGHLLKKIIYDPTFKDFVKATSDVILPLETEAAKMGIKCPSYSSALPGSSSQISLPSSQPSEDSVSLE